MGPVKSASAGNLHKVVDPAKNRRNGTSPTIALAATDQRLMDLLLTKGEEDDVPVLRLTRHRSKGAAANRRLPSSSNSKEPLHYHRDHTRGQVCSNPSPVPETGVLPKDRKASVVLPEGSGGGSGAVGQGPSQPTAMQQQQQLEMEEERRAFLNQVCAESTRQDVKLWMGKTFSMVLAARFAEKEARNRERRRRQARAAGGGAMSDAGFSVFSTNTGHTFDTCTSGTALMTVGGSIAGASFHPGLAGVNGRTSSTSLPDQNDNSNNNIIPQTKGLGARSVDSEESLVVHHNAVEDPLNMKERIQAYLERRIPELETFVNERVAARAAILQKEVDNELAAGFMLQTAQRNVFDEQANLLRWQGVRQQILQKKIDRDMPGWILEAIQGWDEKHVIEQTMKKRNHVDSVVDYLTKRSTNIEQSKLVSEIPIFKTLHASYSLPPMWRDKYL